MQATGRRALGMGRGAFCRKLKESAGQALDLGFPSLGPDICIRLLISETKARDGRVRAGGSPLTIALRSAMPPSGAHAPA